MAAPEHWSRLKRMYGAAPVNRYFEPQLDLGDGVATLTMPVKESSFHTAGALHGSVFFKALDDAAIFAAYSIETEYFVVTSSFTTYILAPVSGGVLEATGRVVSRAGRQFVAESELRCNGNVVAHGNGLFTRTQIPFASIPGYA